MTHRSLRETAELLGRERAVELRCFEVLGARALTAADPTAAVLLDGAAAAHAWRAREVEIRLPVSLGLPGVDDATRSPGAALDAALGALGEEEDDEEVLAILAHLLYPAFLAAYDAHLASTVPIADAPVARMLRRVRADVAAVLGEIGARRAPKGRAAEALTVAIRELGGVFGPAAPD